LGFQIQNRKLVNARIQNPICLKLERGVSSRYRDDDEEKRRVESIAVVMVKRMPVNHHIVLHKYRQ